MACGACSLGFDSRDIHMFFSSQARSGKTEMLLVMISWMFLPFYEGNKNQVPASNIIFQRKFITKQIISYSPELQSILLVSCYVSCSKVTFE